MGSLPLPGGATSTVGDLLRFAEFHMGDGTAEGGRVLSHESVRAMQEPQVEAALAPHWGLGWSVEEIDGVRLVGHGGTTNGFQARLALVPERRLAFAILTNSNLGAAACREVGDALLERLAGLRREEPARVSLPADRLARFSGRYERPGFAVTLAADGDELVVQNDGENVFTKEREPVPPRRAAPVGEARFLVLDGESAGSTFDFVRNEDGAVRFLRFGGRLLERS